ncbi:MAG: DUF6364 family protein [Chloroflexota bacterium]|nr:DUF6364 family protein [Chloroflexota bacterium]MDE2960032.1 DUF6364 family protein [Chloroflexota bacterium]
MKLTLDIDEETAAKVSKIAAAKDMTVEAMVEEYLRGIANSHAASRLERITKFRDALERTEDEARIINLNRDDIYDRPYRFYYGE